MLPPVETAYYRPSGRVSPVGLAAAVVIGGVLTLVLSFLYAVALVYNPSAYLGLALPLLYGAAAGGVVAALGRRFKTRNARVLAIAGTTVAMLGYLLSWIPWEWFALTHMGSEIDVVAVLFPPSFFAMLGFIYENGAWTLGHSADAVSGVLLGAIWLLEAVAVLGASAVTSYGMGSHGVFCETCETWCTQQKDLFRHEGALGAEITRLLDARDLSILKTARRASPGASAWIETALTGCPCGATNTLFVEQVTRTADGRGKSRIERLGLVEHLLIAKHEAEQVRALAAAR